MKNFISCKVCVQWPFMFTFINFFYIDQPRLVKIEIYVYYFLYGICSISYSYSMFPKLNGYYSSIKYFTFCSCSKKNFSQNFNFFKTFAWNMWTLVKKPTKCGKQQLFGRSLNPSNYPFLHDRVFIVELFFYNRYEKRFFYFSRAHDHARARS